MFEEKGIAKPRKERGILAPLAFAALIIAGFVVGALGVDMAHMVYVQNELQSATDAAALSGAQGLSGGADAAERRAFHVCAMNSANGMSITDPDAVVTVLVTTDNPGSPGEVAVTAEMEIEHLLAKIIGRRTDTVTATSTAGAGGSTKSLSGDQAFPFAISLDEGNGPGQPLSGRSLGQSISITVWPPLQAPGGFTTFADPDVACRIELMQTAHANPPDDMGGGPPDNDPGGNPGGGADPGGGGDQAEDLGPGYTDNEGMDYIREAIDQALGLSPEQKGFRPQLRVGQDIYLKNGAAGAEHLNSEGRIQQMVGQTVILPVIRGGAPYNQSRKIIAFIAVEVTGYRTAAGKIRELNGTLVKSIVKGRSGPPAPTGDESVDVALKEVSTSVARLIVNDSSQ